MPEYTSNFNLPKPLANENVSREAHNNLVDLIDSQIGGALLPHVADNAKHLTSAERTAWNAKADQSALVSHVAEEATDAHEIRNISGLSESLSALTESTSKRAYNPNLLPNGCFDVWQRGTTFTSTDIYTADRWYARGAGVTKVEKVLRTINGKNVNALRMELDTSSNFGILDYYFSLYRKLIGQKVSISFKFRSNYQNYYFRFRQGTTGTSILDTGTLTADEQWREIKLENIEVPDAAQEIITLSWQRNVVETRAAGMYIEVADVKLEIGEKATPLMLKSVSEELAICLPYVTNVAPSAYVGDNGQYQVY